MLTPMIDRLDRFLSCISPKSFQRILFLAVSFVWSGYTLFKGKTVSSDSTTYGRWADILIEQGFDYGAWLSEVQSLSLTAPKIFYSTWITLVAFLKIIFGELWPYAVVALNLASSIGIVWLVLAGVWKMSQSRLALLACGIFLGICFDFFLWIPYVLTDVVFSLLVILVYTQIIKNALAGGTSPAISLGAIGLVDLVALFYRPAAIPLLVFSIAGLGFLAWVGKDVVDPQARVRQLRKFVASLGGVLLVLIVWHASILEDPSRWPFAFAKEWVGVLSEEARKGIVVFMRPETYHSPPQSLMDFVFLTLGKFSAFFSFIHNDYSLAHKALNLAFFLPVYTGCLIALVGIFRSGSGMSAGVWGACVMAALLLGTVGLYHAVNQIEFDHRFRVPVLAPMIFMSALGWGHALNRLLNKNNPA